jgi:hypothetical protein
LAAENLPAGVLTNLISQGIIPELVEFWSYSANRFLIYVYFHSRRKWLYEPSGFDLKSCENLVYRAKCGAAYFWNCLCYSCYNGHKKHRKLEERLITILVTPFTTCCSTACLRN